jgi:hypothetical protein
VSDLVKRLRDNQPCCGVFKCDHCLEAAARIEELERENKAMGVGMVELSYAHTAARREALEEAARVAEAEQLTGEPPKNMDQEIIYAVKATVTATSKSIAAAIRALMEKGDE